MLHCCTMQFDLRVIRSKVMCFSFLYLLNDQRLNCQTELPQVILSDIRERVREWNK